MYVQWSDVTEILSCDPPSEASAGQRVVMRTTELGLRFTVVIEIRAVDPDRHVIELDVTLPFGLVNRERITCQPTDDGRTLIRFY